MISWLLPGTGRSLLQPLPEHHQVVLAHFVDCARGQVGEREGAIGGADQAGDAQAEMFEDAAHFAVLAFGKRQLDPDVRAGAAFDIGVDRAVADALDLDPVDQLFQLRLGDLAISAGAVGAGHAGRRQFQLALQLAVGGQQQQPFGIQVEPADRHHPRQALGQPIVDGRAAFRVALGREQPRRLVVAEQPGRGGRRHRLAVHGQAVKRLDERRGRLHHSAVEGNPAFGDHPFDLAARRHAGARQQLGDPLRFPWLSR